MALSFLLIITACYNPVTQKTNTSARQSGTASECLVIQHRLGETCIPTNPQRIIALDVQGILDPLLALDIKPIGTAVDHFGDGENWSGRRYFPALLPELVTGIESVGAEGTPSLEKILELKPDLILLADQAELSYKQLSKIAPTVIINTWKDNIPIKENFRYIAKIVGAEEKAEKVLNQYQKRVSEFQKRLGNRLVGLEVSVISHYGNQFWISPKFSSFFQVFQDIGLPIKPIFLEQKSYSTISIEAINKLDADVLFLIKDANDPSSLISQNPLILSLEAVKNKRAYIVDRKIWDFYGPIGMNLFLDDLYKYLINTP